MQGTSQSHHNYQFLVAYNQKENCQYDNNPCNLKVIWNIFLWVCVHTWEKSFRNLIRSNQNQIVFTIFQINRKMVNTMCCIPLHGVCWNQIEIGLYLLFSKFPIWKIVDTIWFRFDLIRFICVCDWCSGQNEWNMTVVTVFLTILLVKN